MGARVSYFFFTKNPNNFLLFFGVEGRGGGGGARVSARVSEFFFTKNPI